MKNKHLLLLFLATVALGLLSRRLHWSKSGADLPLIRLDTAAVAQISIAQPGQSELLFERSDEGNWSVEHEGRTYPVFSADVAPMLTALADLRSVRKIGPTARPDTLGLSEKNALRLQLLEGTERHVHLAIGHQAGEKNAPATYLRLGENGDTYLVKHHLRDVFSQKIDFFRKNHVAQFDPADVYEMTCTWPGDTSFFLQKNDSLRCWLSPGARASLPDDSLQIWLSQLAALRDLPFADDFDDTRSRQTLRAEIHLRSRSPSPLAPRSSSPLLTLRLHRLAPPELPEEISPSSRPARRLPVAWALHSSQNPLNYFWLPDSAVFFRWHLRK
jgi:hypothetical protein